MLSGILLVLFTCKNKILSGTNPWYFPLLNDFAFLYCLEIQVKKVLFFLSDLQMKLRAGYIWKTNIHSMCYKVYMSAWPKNLIEYSIIIRD